MEDERLGVVLVHGFKSGSAAWDSFRLLASGDAELGAVTFLPFTYSTSIWQLNPLRMIPGFDTVADSFKEFLDTECRDFDRLIVVTHSQGGLIMQRFLSRMAMEGRAADVSRIRRVVMLACPNTGAEVALSLRRRIVRSNPQEAELRPLNEQVADTQRIVLRQFVNARSITARTCPLPFSVFAGESDNVVPPASARGVFPDAAALPGDHFSIVGMDSLTHRTYTTLRRLILSVLAIQVSSPPASAVAKRSDDRARGALPELFTVVGAAENVTDMDDPEFRRSVLRLMRAKLAPAHGFTVAYKPNMRDHLVEIVQHCLDHRAPDMALRAFTDGVSDLRPDDRGTALLRAAIGARG
ncbi:alpha/beta fold hydrolase [Streptomyces phaeochromogenes]|uniref:alpha/beta fold hydrolase n=1 Tax=Streptomyces phaeochromogenes TaxID=1923 RepID=UPI00386E3F53|nr:alpha/beta hydrolase [Streptomyces phaeochromogenes]